jgi:prepilin-type N-terminal cleavage/methylation domain
MKKSAFTLIELLIVIALLGALAVGLLAAVDPFEQLKKGRDTSTRNTAAEFFNAAIRYYAQRSQFPWDVVNELTTGNATTLANLSGSISEAIAAGELKADFYNLAGGSSNLARINVYYPASEQAIVCFQPESKAFRNDKNTIYNSTGSQQATNVCPNATSTSCYICFK